jgi:hypothetical protein
VATTIRFLPLLISGFIATLAPASAQIPERYREALRAQKRLSSAEQGSLDSTRVQLEISLDRQAYLTQEVNRATIGIFNPTTESLSVLDPFDVRAGCVDINV